MIHPILHTVGYRAIWHRSMRWPIRFCGQLVWGPGTLAHDRTHDLISRLASLTNILRYTKAQYVNIDIIEKEEAVNDADCGRQRVTPPLREVLA